MTRTSRSLTAEHTLLAGLREQEQAARAAEARKLALAAEWAEAHQAGDGDEVACFGDSPIPIAGPGCPLVMEFAVVEAATVLGMGQVAGRHYLGQALELKHRLPRCWARVMDGTVPAWRARRLAEQTTSLTLEAVAYVDAQIAPFLHGIGIRAQERLVAEAINRFMPDLADQHRAAAAETRHFDIDRDQVTWAGTVEVHAELDLADAYDLDAAIAGCAHQQLALGSVESLDVRRAKAAGQLARTQLALGFDFDLAEQTSPDGQANEVTITEREGLASSTTLQGTGRQVLLYLHLQPEGHAELEGRGGPHLLSAETVKEWLQTPGTNVTIRPVLDLAEELSTTSYQPTDLIREQAILINRRCVFPHCTLHARRADLDHIEAYDDGGPTTSSNLGPLCRLHHRVKTFDHWTYVRLAPGVYEWTGPHGHRYRVDRTGTTHLTPPDE